MGKILSDNRNKKGFTIAELMIVVSIIAILALVSVPIFSTFIKNQREKHVAETELAAKTAAVTAFYAGFDSNGNPVDISSTGCCTFLYDAENGKVYVSNTPPDVSDFEGDYLDKISRYGISVPNGKDHSGQVILVSFDGRYTYHKNKKYTDYPNFSKGTFEEPILSLEWEDAESLITGEIDD